MTNSQQARPEPEAAPEAPAQGRGGRASRARALRTLGLVAVGVVAGAAAGALALYGMKGLSGNAPPAQTGLVSAAAAAPADAGCAGAAAQAKALEPFAKGELAALKLTTTPKAVPDLAFTDGAGQPVSLSDFKGRVLLVNLWATWCVPCRKEMPELDHLQASLGGPDFEVVAINLDTRDPDKAQAFLKEINVSRLRFFADPQTRSFHALRAVGRGFGLPTSLLVDGQGCELGYLAGPAAWGGDDAKALVRAAVAGAAGH